MMDTAVPRAANVEAGRAFMARIGIRHRETQVACIMKAQKNLGGEPRICEQTGKIPLDMC